MEASISRYFVTKDRKKIVKYLRRTVCSYDVTYTFRGESTPEICLNFKGFLARNRRDIWSLGDCNMNSTAIQFDQVVECSFTN